MAGTLRQAMVFLGLADDGYEETTPQGRAPQRGEEREPLRHEAEAGRGRQRPARGSHSAEEEYSAPARPAEREDYRTEEDYEVLDHSEVLENGSRHRDRAPEPSETFREPRDEPSREVVHSPSRAVRRREEYRAPVTPINRAAAQSESDNELRRITTIHPRSYNDAKVIGESFRSNIPVIMNVTDMDVSEAKRLVDFSSGLTFALNGSIERVTEQVFLLTPANLEVLASEDVAAHAAHDEGVFDQD